MFRRTQLAFVLGGGGARGALQAGALRALVEAQVEPDILVGTSAGAINATYLAVHGYSPHAIEGLVAAWHAAARADLLPTHYTWVAVRLLLRQPGGPANHRIRDFYMRQGLSPEMRFEQLVGPELYLVASNLRQCRPKLYGLDKHESVLDGVMASTALPPWVLPLASGGQLLMDGGLASNLPIEPALSVGATEIVALDVDDDREAQALPAGLAAFLVRVVLTAQQREKDLELALAAARRVRLHHLRLQLEQPVALWDFRHTTEAVERGYALTRAAIERHRLAGRGRWGGWLPWRRALRPGEA
jgi:NTE family protein